MTYPGTRALSDAALLLCAQLREEILQGRYSRQEDDTVVLTNREFRYEVERCRARCGNGWGSQMRGMSLDRVIQELTDYMAQWMLLEKLEGGILLDPAVGKLVGCYPAVGKWTGAYPADYQEKNREGDTDGPVEDA